MHRVTIARYGADVQATLEDELAWELRALAAAVGSPTSGRRPITSPSQ